MSDWISGAVLADRFTLIRPLGSGGMGEVWRVHDRELQIDVVAKRVPARAGSEQIELLRRECLSARRLSHPNVVRVFDFHQADPAPFITMELIEGRDLCDLRGGRPDEILRTLIPVAEALDHAHRLGVVHRDLKCSNVLLDAAGEPRVADFGIAGLLEPGADEVILAGGGTRHRSSPQQLDGAPPSVADDVYGLGCLLFELLAGRPPFPPDADLDTLRRVPPPALTSRYRIPESLAELATRMLAKSPHRRPAEMGEVAEEMRRSLAELSADETLPPARAGSAVRLTPPPRILPPPTDSAGAAAVRRGVGRGRPGPWTLAAFAVAIAALLAVFALLPRWVERSRASAGQLPQADEARRASLPETSPVDEGDSAVAVRPEPPPPADESASAGAPAAARTGAPPADRPIDRASPPAAPPSEGAKRVSPDPRPERAFAEAMTEGLAASERGDHEAARVAFRRALTLSPGAEEAMDGLAAAELELRLAEIGERRRRAASHESAERWHEAMEEYRAVQQIDATILFAQEGLARSRRRAELDDKLISLLADPERLSAEEVLTDATATLAAAETIEPRGARLEDQIRRLAREIEAAATPVEVVLLSDAVTRVMVYRVGRLGSFERKTLELRPGRYTVVGSREGFRDVRLELHVEAGKPLAPLVVRCEEEF